MKKVFVFAILLYVNVSYSQIEEITTFTEINTPEKKLPLPLAEKDLMNEVEAKSIINRNATKAVISNVTYFGSLTLEYGVLAPWGNRIMKKFKDAQNTDDSSAIIGESMGYLFAGLGVGSIKIVGATAACASASRSYGAYHDGINRNTKDIYVWKPYVAGWVLGA